MKTFRELRALVLAKAKVDDHFKYRAKGETHSAFWDEMNDVEYKRGYTKDYLKPDSPQLCDMQLLTEEEFDAWFARSPA